MLKRRSNGQAIVEGSAFLIILVSVCSGLLLFLIAVVTAHFYNMKILNAAEITARSVVANTFWEGNQFSNKPDSFWQGNQFLERSIDVTPEQRTMISNLLKTLGLPYGDNNWSVTVHDDGANNCVVKLSVSALPILGCGVFPNSLSLSATATTPWNLGHPPCSVMVATTVGQVIVPAYRPYPGLNGLIPSTVQKDAGGTYVFAPPVPYFQYPINYAGTGSAQGGGSTFTGSNLAAFAPFMGTPAAPPPNSAFPQ